ncbi:MAG: sigma-70 family RNA polymerase sigma factor [Bacilli bacterium]|nr:sigma-70 family RNA polymerase sigma factor [Bacilli bacterium]MBR3049586.1 sigma-70 family RNA polymerase sigma factor [Bacilli bacterium]
MEDILEYENLVYSIINKYKNFDREDLYQVGMIGLIDAKRNYKEEVNTKFSTYAYFYILGKVKEYIRKSNPYKISKDIIKLNKSIEKATDIMSQRLGRNPTDLELSLFLEIDEEKIIETRQALQNIKSLDYNEENIDLYNSIKVEDKNINSDILDLKEAINNLSKEEQNIIIDRYFNDLTQTEVSKELGMSQVQVSRKETKILQKLKATL